MLGEAAAAVPARDPARLAEAHLPQSKFIFTHYRPAHHNNARWNQCLRYVLSALDGSFRGHGKVDTCGAVPTISHSSLSTFQAPGNFATAAIDAPAVIHALDVD